MRGNKVFQAIILIIPVISFLLFFFYWPLSNLVQIALTSGMSKWIEVVTHQLFFRFLIFTILQSLLTVLGTLLIGLPVGYLLARSKAYWISTLRAAITLPFLFPPLVILLGFVIMFEPNGLIAEIYSAWDFNPFSFWGIVFAHITYNVSVVARISEAAFKTEPAIMHDLSSTFGASWWYRFRTVSLPHIKPSLESAILLVFLYSFNSFAIVLILGEVKLQTLEVMIYNQSRLRFNIERAAIIAVIQLIINLIVIWLYVKRQTYQTREISSEPIKPTINPILSTIAIVFVILITWIPIITVSYKTITGFINSPAVLQDELISGGYDRYLGTSSKRVIGNTFFFGFAVAIISILLSSAMVLTSFLFNNSSKVEKIFVPLTLLPMGTSAITFSFSLLMTHGRFTGFSDLVWIYIIVAQVIAALPFASRAIFSSWSRVPQDLILVSRTLGGSYFKTLKDVVFPYMKPALLIAFLFSFAISIGEFGATYYLVRGEWVTLSLAIDRLFTSRNALLPNMYATLLVLTALISFWIIEKLGSLEMRL